MLISMDHDCTPDCPVCIPEEDLLKFVKKQKIVPQCPACIPEKDLLKVVKKRKIVPQSTPRAMWLLYTLYVFVAVTAVGVPFWVASAISGQDLQSHVASGNLTGGQSSIGLAERLELIELLLKDVRLLLPESTQILAAKEADISAIKYPNPGPSPSRGNLDSSPAASSSQKKPDALAAPHPTGNDHLFRLTMAALLYAMFILILSSLAIGGYLAGTDSDNSGRNSDPELLDVRTDSDYSARYSCQDSGCPLHGAGTNSDYSGQDSGCPLLGAGTNSNYSDQEQDSGWEQFRAWTDSDYSDQEQDSGWEQFRAWTDGDYFGGDSGLGTDSDYSGRDSGWEQFNAWTETDYSDQDQDSGWEQFRAWTDGDYFGGDSGLGTDSDYSGRDSGWGTNLCWETDSDYSGRDSRWALLRSGTNEELNDALTEGASNSDDETISVIQEPVIIQEFVGLPKDESSCSPEKMISSSIEAEGFSREVELDITIAALRLAGSTTGGFLKSDITISAQRLAGSTTGGFLKSDITISAQRLAGSTTGSFLKSNEGLSDSETTESLQLDDDEKSVQSDEMEKSGQSEEVNHESGSDEEMRAATMVQARYKGHLVRMSRPLVQLREIAGIEERLKKLKELAGDGAFIDFLRKKESMAKLAIEEETLKLLLRLDSIQGSHPLVRQIRKSVAQEIVSLQENFSALLSMSINKQITLLDNSRSESRILE